LYRLDEEQKYFRLFYPSDQAAVAPTSIGNIVRTVDSYTDSLYGLDASLVLPRLRDLLSAPLQTQLSDTEDRLALLEWSWFGTVVVGILGSAIAAYFGKYGLAAIT